MYLAAINKSIRENSIKSKESITINGQIYATINELQWLFSATEEATHSKLISTSGIHFVLNAFTFVCTKPFNNGT
jgi:hypothetical protein